ncbi:hypothetical protein HOY80DRAFT_995133 [Tuber brumale]|nr:hypothetical protein HOY80DRAFT_995133 [Tuber brumale]
MGQIIEWLIFGFMPNMVGAAHPEAWVGGSLYIVGWGSRPGNYLQINNYVCRRLMQTRPHLRMPAPELRVFTENLRREEEAEEIDSADLGEHYEHYEEVTAGSGPPEPRTPSPAPGASTGSPGREGEPGETEPMDLDDGHEGAVAIGEAPDVDAARSGVSIPNTASGRAFRHAFISLEAEIERARATGRARGRANRAISCRLGEIWDSDPDVRLHNNLSWRTNETPPVPTGFLPFLANSSDRRIIMVVYIFLCIASDYGLRRIFPTFTSAYSSMLTATIMVLGLFSVRIPDP